MFEDEGLGHLLGDFPADNRLEIRVDGVSRFFGDDPYTSKLSGRLVPQQALVRNLIGAFIEDGGDLLFEAADAALDGLDTERPVVRYVGADGAVREIACDFVAGCDGDHGVTNASVPVGAVAVHELDYGITWLAVQAEASPPRHALMAAGERGYAAQYFRGPALSRFYLQVDPPTRSRTGRRRGSGKSCASACTARNYPPGRSPRPSCSGCAGWSASR